MHKGKEMLNLGIAVLQSAHDTLPGGDDEDRWNEFSAAFVTGLVRRALVQLRDSQVQLLHSLLTSTVLCPNRLPKQMAIIQRKLCSFVWNFRHSKRKSSKEEWRISLEKKHARTSILLTSIVHHWKYEVYNTAASHCSFYFCFAILRTDVLQIPVLWVSSAFSTLDAMRFSFRLVFFSFFHYIADINR